jgi:hypothetical protein
MFLVIEGTKEISQFLQSIFLIQSGLDKIEAEEDNVRMLEQGRLEGDSGISSSDIPTGDRNLPCIVLRVEVGGGQGMVFKGGGLFACVLLSFFHPKEGLNELHCEGRAGKVVATAAVVLAVVVHLLLFISGTTPFVPPLPRMRRQHPFLPLSLLRVHHPLQHR